MQQWELIEKTVDSKVDPQIIWGEIHGLIRVGRAANHRNSHREFFNRAWDIISKQHTEKLRR